MPKRVLLHEDYIYAGKRFLKGKEHVVPDDFKVHKGTGKILEEGLSDGALSQPDESVEKFEPGARVDTGADSTQEPVEGAPVAE